jgi:hypothetical protein
MRSISHPTLIITSKHKQTIKVVQFQYITREIGSVSNTIGYEKTIKVGKTLKDASPFCGSWPPFQKKLGTAAMFSDLSNTLLTEDCVDACFEYFVNRAEQTFLGYRHTHGRRNT